MGFCILWVTHFRNKYNFNTFCVKIAVIVFSNWRFIGNKFFGLDCIFLSVGNFKIEVSYKSLSWWLWARLVGTLTKWLQMPENMSGTRLSRLKPLRGFTMSAPNPALFVVNSLLGNALSSPTSSPNKLKFGFRTEGISVVHMLLSVIIVSLRIMWWISYIFGCSWGFQMSREAKKRVIEIAGSESEIDRNEQAFNGGKW